MITKFFKRMFNDLKRVDKILLVCSLVLLIIGLVMVFSASNDTSSVKFNDRNYYFYRQLFYIALGLGAGFASMMINTKYYGITSWALTGIFIVLLIVVLTLPEATNGSRSWLPLFGGFKFQPSEFVKIISIVWMSHLCCAIPRLKLVVRYVLLFLVVAVNFALIAVEPDLGTAVIYLSAIFFMFLALDKTEKTKKRLFIGGAVVVLIFSFLLFFTKASFLVDRIESRMTFRNPCSEENFYTTGTQLCNGYIAFNNGGLFGVGLGNSTQKHLYLPEAYTDFILAIVVEELGFIPSFLILGLMFVCLWRIYLIAKRATSPYCRLICYGIFWYILVHIIINVLGVTGIIPLTGVPLPFLSYGGSFMICLITALGFVQRVNIETRYEKNQ